MALAGAHARRWVAAEWTAAAFLDGGPSCSVRAARGGAGTGQAAPGRACARTDRTCCTARGREPERKSGNGYTDHFTRAEIRSPPRGGVGRATIVAPTSDPVAKLRRCIIRVSNGIMVLARKGVRQRS